MPQYHVSIPTIGKVFLILVAIESLLVSAATIAVLAQSPSHATVYYCVLVLLTIGFLVYFAVDSVVQENTYQLGAFILLTLLLTLRVVYNFVYEVTDGSNTATHYLILLSMVVAGVMQLVFFPLGYKVYSSFGWRMFKRVGASTGIINMFKAYQVFLSIIKVDVQFCIVVTLMAGFFLDFHWAFGVIVSGLFITLVLSYVVIDFGIKMERRPVVYAYLAFSLVAPAYIFYKLAMIYQDESLIKNVDGEDSRDTTRSLIVVSAMLFLMGRVACMVSCAVCLRNFGRSLKEVVFDKESNLLDKLRGHGQETGDNLEDGSSASRYQRA